MRIPYSARNASDTKTKYINQNASSRFLDYNPKLNERHGSIGIKIHKKHLNTWQLLRHQEGT
jgi:hypothetical protein